MKPSHAAPCLPQFGKDTAHSYARRRHSAQFGAPILTCRGSRAPAQKSHEQAYEPRNLRESDPCISSCHAAFGPSRCGLRLAGAAFATPAWRAQRCRHARALAKRQAAGPSHERTSHTAASQQVLVVPRCPRRPELTVALHCSSRSHRPPLELAEAAR